MMKMDPLHIRLQDDLRGLVTGEVRCDSQFLQLYSSDGSIHEQTPMGVVLPRSETDVQACLAYANEKGYSVHARGAGSGVAGESLGEGIVLDFSCHLRQTLDQGDDWIRFESGIVRRRLNQSLRASYRIFGPDPATGTVSTMGSTLAINGAGSHWLKYGLPSDYVRSLRIVLASGDILDVGRETLTDGVSQDANPVKRALINDLVMLWRDYEASKKLSQKKTSQSCLSNDSYSACDFGDSSSSIARPRVGRCGYRLEGILQKDVFDLAGLICGSEGTLALITSATVSTLPLAKQRGALFFLFGRMDVAAETAVEILQYRPTACDLLDRRTLSLAREADARFENLIPQETEAALLVELDGASESELSTRLIELVERFVERRRVAFDVRIARDSVQTEIFWLLSSGMSPSVYRSRLRPVPGVEDVAIPPESLPSFLQETQSLLRTLGITTAMRVHVGHGGVHLYPFLNLNNPSHVAFLQQLALHYHQLVRRFGGNIQSEHGIGFSRTPFLRSYIDATTDQLFRQIKRRFDPKGILNPKKLTTDYPDLGIGSFLRKPAIPENLLQSERLDSMDSLQRLEEQLEREKQRLSERIPFSSHHSSRPIHEREQDENFHTPAWLTCQTSDVASDVALHIHTSHLSSITPIDATHSNVGNCSNVVPERSTGTTDSLSDDSATNVLHSTQTAASAPSFLPESAHGDLSSRPPFVPSSGGVSTFAERLAAELTRDFSAASISSHAPTHGSVSPPPSATRVPLISASPEKKPEKKPEKSPEKKPEKSPEKKPFAAQERGVASGVESDVESDETLRDLFELQVDWKPAEMADYVRPCNGCGDCRARIPEMRTCPIFRVDPREQASPRAKINLVRGILSGELPRELITEQASREIADLCISCHACSVECPAQVQVAKMMSELRGAYVAANGLSFQEWFVCRLDLWCHFASRLSPFTRNILHRPRFRWLLEKLAGVARNRRLPKISSQPFLRRAARLGLTHWSRHSDVHLHTKIWDFSPPTDSVKSSPFVESGRTADVVVSTDSVHLVDSVHSISSPLALQTIFPARQTPESRTRDMPLELSSQLRVAYFVDLFANYHDPSIAEALVSILKRHEISVYVPANQTQSGNAAIRCGALDLARYFVRRNVQSLVDAARQGYTILASDPSAVLALRQEYPMLLPEEEDVQLVANATQDACSFLRELHRQGQLHTDFRAIPLSIGYYQPCRLLALDEGVPDLDLLRLIPELKIKKLVAGCCGMANAYGLRAIHFRDSLRIGRNLASVLRDSSFTWVATSCGSCRMQIEQMSDKSTCHPLRILATAYGLQSDFKTPLLTVRDKRPPHFDQ